MNKFCVFLLPLIYTLSSCNHNDSERGTYHPIDTTNMIHLSGEIITHVRSSGCMEMLDFGNYIVMSANIDKKLFHVISKDGVIVKSVGHFGRGNNEFLAVANIQRVNDRDFMVYDASNKRVSYYNLDAILEDELTPYNKINIKSNEVINNLYHLSDDSYLCLGGYVESKPIKRFSVITSDGVVMSRYDIYPGRQDSLAIAKAYSLQPPAITFSPSTKSMVVANKPIGAIMELFANRENSIKPLGTKYIIKPEVDVTSNNIIANPEDIIAGFTDIYMTERGIYAAYIGAKTDSYPATKLVMFSNKGDVEKIFATDYLNSQILFDEKAKTFYAFTMMPTGEVVLMKYNVSDFI